MSSSCRVQPLGPTSADQFAFDLQLLFGILSSPSIPNHPDKSFMLMSRSSAKKYQRYFAVLGSESAKVHYIQLGVSQLITQWHGAGHLALHLQSSNQRLTSLCAQGLQRFIILYLTTNYNLIFTYFLKIRGVERCRWCHSLIKTPLDVFPHGWTARLTFQLIVHDHSEYTH